MKNLTRRERIGVLSLAIVAILLISGALFLRRQSSGVPDSSVSVGVEYSPEADTVRDGDSDESSRIRRNVKKRKKRKKRKRKASVSERANRGSQDTSQYNPFEPVPLKQHDCPATDESDAGRFYLQVQN